MEELSFSSAVLFQIYLIKYVTVSSVTIEYGVRSEIVKVSDTFEYVLLQSTSLCNINCDYCYLPTRKDNNIMNIEVAEKVADSISRQENNSVVEIFWHGGEPLVTPKDHFRTLLGCFESLRRERRIEHNLQTNAILVDNDWCQLFKEFDIDVGISLDGPSWANSQRVDWGGKPMFDSIMKGVEILKRNDIPFSVIAVVNDRSITRAKELYKFFSDLGCKQLAINIEEVEGINLGTIHFLDDDRVEVFWANLYEAWRNKPNVQIREVTATLKHIAGIVGEGEPYSMNPQPIDPFPVVDYDGNVVLLSPGFSGISSTNYEDFYVGNVLQKSLSEIIDEGKKSDYVNDFVNGIRKCANNCECFDFCGGGYSGSKYFETGSTNATQTVSCRNSRQRLLDAVAECMIK